MSGELHELGPVLALRRFATAMAAAGVPFGPPSDRRYRDSALGLSRAVLGVVRPRSHDDVVKVVRAAIDGQMRLYPISTGMNWGLGSALPVEDGCILVDLGGMNRILGYDARTGCARIEPGVTQRQLAEFLAAQGAPHILDVTGSSPESSILGNALERGVTYARQRVDALSNLRVVCGDGSELRTGFGGMTGGAVADLYRHGLGPSLDGLFFQSSLGIVTEATVALMRRPEREERFLAFSFDDAALPAVMEALRELTARGHVRGITHVANRARTVVSIGPRLQKELDALRVRTSSSAVLQRELRDWSGMATLAEGAKAQREARKAFRRVGGRVRIHVLTDRRLAAARVVANACGLRRLAASLACLEETRKLSRGTPSPIALEEFGRPDVASSRRGFGYILPVGPLGGREAADVVARVRAECGIDAAITLNVLGPALLEGVISVHFDKDEPLAGAMAHAALDRANDALVDLGFLPYRLSIRQMDTVMKDHPLQGWFRALKVAFDPHGVLAPGRYIVDG